MTPNTTIDQTSELPVETKIYYAKRKLKRILKIVTGFMIGIPLITLLMSYVSLVAYFFGTFIMLFLIMIYADTKKRYNNNSPQIIISDDGIETAKIPFFGWGSISGEDVETYYQKNNNGEFFIYNYPVGREKVFMSNLETNKSELKELLKIYRARYNKKHSGA